MRKTFLLLALALCLRASQIPSLGSYDVDINQTSVSGLSSGAYFAVQMQVAFSSTFVGAGIFAGGPYHCSDGSLNHALNHCMQTNREPDIPPLVSITNDRAQTGLVDPTSNLASHKVFMFSGTKDTTIPTPIMDGLREYYDSYIDSSNIVYVNTLKAAHTQPTDDHVNKNACTTSATPYISYCDYDGSGLALAQIYGDLNARNDGTLSGDLIQFDQSEFVGSNLGMADLGWLYVPAVCAAGNQCKLHVSFHGCKQDYNAIGDAWIQDTGYNKWADTNNMIILYPQTEKSYFNPSNSYGCWDWWGYNNPDNFDTKNGDQMNAVWQMIQRITSGFASLSPPTNLRATDVTETSVSLQWGASSSPNVSYSVYRDGSQIVSAVNGLTYVDNTVDSGTAYSYTVKSQDSEGHQSPDSGEVDVTTSGTPPPLQAPINLVSTETSAFYVVLSWSPATGASGYNVYRNSSLLSSTSQPLFNDTTVSPLSSYLYEVTSTNGSVESSPSPSLAVSTPSGWSCTSYTSSNYEHVHHGRAYEKLGYTYAEGSDQYIGLYNTAVYDTLAETTEGYYVLGGC